MSFQGNLACTCNASKLNGINGGEAPRSSQQLVNAEPRQSQRQVSPEPRQSRQSQSLRTQQAPTPAQENLSQKNLQRIGSRDGKPCTCSKRSPSQTLQRRGSASQATNDIPAEPSLTQEKQEVIPPEKINSQGDMGEGPRLSASGGCGKRVCSSRRLSQGGKLMSTENINAGEQENAMQEQEATTQPAQKINPCCLPTEPPSPPPPPEPEPEPEPLNRLCSCEGGVPPPPPPPPPEEGLCSNCGGVAPQSPSPPPSGDAGCACDPNPPPTEPEICASCAQFENYGEPLPPPPLEEPPACTCPPEEPPQEEPVPPQDNCNDEPPFKFKIQIQIFF